MRTIRKAVFEEIVDGFDYSDRMEPGDSLTSSIWELADGLEGTSTFDDTSTSVEVTGGTATTQYLATNKVETALGQKYQRSFKVIVVDR